MSKIAFLHPLPRLIAFAPMLFFNAAWDTAFADTFVSPSIGVTAGDTLRLSVVNNGMTTETETLTFFDNMGNILATTTQAVEPGHEASLDFTTDLARLEVHASRSGTVNFPPRDQSFAFGTQLNGPLVENFLLSPPTLGPARVSPSIGLTAGQTARLSVVNDGTTTETETLQIMNAMGAIVAERIVTLAAGEVGSLDFATTSARMEIHGKASPGGFPVDLQIFDSTSMRTTALVETFLPSPPETTATLVSPSIGFGGWAGRPPLGRQHQHPQRDRDAFNRR
jgi:hypothetical protein